MSETGIDPFDDLLKALYESVLRRAPAEAEAAQWRAMRDLSPAELVRRFVRTPGVRRHAGVATFFPNGHYHSPVVDPDAVRPYVGRARRAGAAGLVGIALDVEAMWSLLEEAAPALAALTLYQHATPDRRYHVAGSPFPAGDAASLCLVMAQYAPRRIVEIGSGYSTAAALDIADMLGLNGLSIRCIEPDPARLRRLLRDADGERVTIVEALVQDVPVEEVTADLAAGDILLIDSTHVLKTGSDVHYELFTLIPSVAPGVLVHVHDCPFPFEYSDMWVLERNYSWNEAYALRAFLMFNDAFRVRFWAGLLGAFDRARLTAACRHYTPNLGSSIWLERVA